MIENQSTDTVSVGPAHHPVFLWAATGRQTLGTYSVPGAVLSSGRWILTNAYPSSPLSLSLSSIFTRLVAKHFFRLLVFLV